MSDTNVGQMNLYSMNRDKYKYANAFTYSKSFQSINFHLKLYKNDNTTKIVYYGKIRMAAEIKRRSTHRCSTRRGSPVVPGTR